MEKIVNDFVVNVATANGTGSQSSNLIILHSMFEMGVPVSGKNLFPSNISGLPTWFIIRASDRGYQAPGDGTNIQILMNKDLSLIHISSPRDKRQSRMPSSA